MADDDPTLRPSWIRRFAAGAWHVPGGAIFLLWHPRLWPLALVPAVLGVAGFGAGLLFGLSGVRAVESAVAAHRPHVPDLVDLVAIVGLWAGTLASGVLAALAIVLLACAPLLECLGRRAEALAGGSAATGWPQWQEWPPTFGRSLYLLPAVPAGFAVSLVPFVGPVLAGWGLARVLALQQMAAPLARRGLDASARRRWQREWRAEGLGFGFAGLILLPLAGPILAPALAVGAALLVYEIAGDAPTAPSLTDAPVTAPAPESFEESFS